MTSRFIDKHKYVFNLIEAINNTLDVPTKRYLARHMKELDGKPVRAISAFAGVCEGKMINSWWCIEVKEVKE